MSKREVLSRYRGSTFGLLWSFLQPVALLGLYTFVFGVVFQARWGLPVEGSGEFALVLFAGLVVFTLFSECVLRAPFLLLAYPAYVKRVVFPLEGPRARSSSRCRRSSTRACGRRTSRTRII
jgi:lipopolysaccharide transport system permease protein